MIKVTMDQIIDFRTNANFFSDVNLPLKGAYKLNKIRKAVEKEGEFYTEKFQEILNQFAKKDEDGELVFSEDGDQIMIKDDMIDECNKALLDLQELEVEIENYNLTLEDFGEEFTCTPDQLAVLMPFMD